MIGETGSGSSFRGLNHYLLHGSASTEPRIPTWVELRNLAGSNPDNAWDEMQSTANENLRAKDPVLHLIISPAPEDQLTGDQWSQLADRVLGDLGLAEHEALVVLHTDTDVPHLHLSVNRIHPRTHRAWNTWRSKARLEAILRAVERDWGLRHVPGRLTSGERDAELPVPRSRGERAQRRHRASDPQVVEWRRTLAPHFRDATSWTELAARLEGVNGVHHLRAQGRGLVVTDGKVYVKASSIDRSFSRARLEARFGQSFADWRSSLKSFDGAVATYVQRASTSPDHPHSRAALRVLKATGRSLGWRALSQVRAPLPASVLAIPLAARRRARALDRERQGSWHALVERNLAPALSRARSWAEADARLRLYGAWLAPTQQHGRGLVVTDGTHQTFLSALGRGVGERELTARFGPWRTWEHTRRHIVSRADRLRRVEASLEERTQRWTRLTRIIQRHELRVERHRALRAEYDAAEAHLRRLVRPHLPPRTTDGELSRTLARLRDNRREPIESLFPPTRSRRFPRFRRNATVPPELRQALRDFRHLQDQIDRTRKPARAARRLERLRHRARATNPNFALRRAQEALLAAVRTAGRAGLASLLARAAPGLGTALTVVRLAARASRAAARDDRSR